MVTKEALPNFQDKRPSFYMDRAMSYLGQFGRLEAIETQMGNTVILLPSREVPIQSLIPENWETATQMGNFRSVKSIDRLQDSTKPYVVVKSPERTFSRNPKALARGDIWWGGRRSQQAGINLGINSVVEEQVMWEAVMLLGLNSMGVRAELPQAIVEYADGRKELIVSEIRQGLNVFEVSNNPSYEQLIARAKDGGFITEDATHYNCLRDEQGRNCIIDINRWEWPPHTDDYRRVLLETISSGVATIQ